MIQFYEPSKKHSCGKESSVLTCSPTTREDLGMWNRACDVCDVICVMCVMFVRCGM